MTVLEVDEITLKTIERLIYGFLWKANDRIKRKTIIGELFRGGINMVDVESKVLSLRASWVKRLLNPESDNRKILDSYLNVYGLNFKYLLKGNFSKPKDMKSFKIPPFYVNVLVSFHKCKSNRHISTNDILGQPLWCNSNVHDKTNVFVYKN